MEMALHKFLLALCLVVFLCPVVFANYTPILDADLDTDAASAAALAKNITLNAHSHATGYHEVWFIYGGGPGTYSARTPIQNISCPASFNATVTAGFFPGSTVYIRAGGTDGYGDEVTVVVPTITPLAQTTYHVRADTIINANFDLLPMMVELPKAFGQQMGAPNETTGTLIFWAFVISCIFIVLYLRSENVMTPALLGLILSWVLLAFVPADFKVMGYALMVVSMGVLLYVIIKGRVR